jgi:hypothetical protein
MATQQQIYWIQVLAGNSPFLANLSTRQNDPIRKWVGLAKFVNIRQPCLLGLARLADIRQTILRGLTRLVKGKFCMNSASLVNLASLANLGGVG